MASDVDGATASEPRALVSGLQLHLDAESAVLVADEPWAGLRAPREPRGSRGPDIHGHRYHRAGRPPALTVDRGRWAFLVAGRSSAGTSRRRIGGPSWSPAPMAPTPVSYRRRRRRRRLGTWRARAGHHRPCQASGSPPSGNDSRPGASSGSVAARRTGTIARPRTGPCTALDRSRHSVYSPHTSPPRKEPFARWASPNRQRRLAAIAIRADGTRVPVGCLPT